MSDPDDSFDDLLMRSLNLGRDDRSRLLEALLASLQSAGDQAIEAEWADEIERRVAALDAGTADLVDGEEAFDRARRSLRSKS